MIHRIITVLSLLVPISGSVYGSELVKMARLRALDIQAKEASVNPAEKLFSRIFKLAKEEKYQQAIPLAIRAIPEAEEVSGERSDMVGRAANWLAFLYYRVGEYSKAETFGNMALDIHEENKSEAIHGDLRLLGNINKAEKKYSNAAVYFKRAYEISMRLDPVDNSRLVRDANDLASCYGEMKLASKAIELYEQVLRINKEEHGSEHFYVAVDYRSLADCFKSQSDYNKAIPLYQKAIEIHQTSVGENDYFLARALNSLGLCFSETKSYDEAKEVFSKAFEIRNELHGPKDYRTAIVMFNLGLVYHDVGDYKKAEPLVRTALEVYEKSFGQEDDNTQFIFKNYTLILKEIMDHKKGPANTDADSKEGLASTTS
jgi:tetratricopeptide (TPR) repeat protein